ncbi:MAG: single-stranded DNA-binding protein [Verrucomicrobiae bacterium]|nr:single-stranded DNA-binding protein [Verrucomicrobiae bacterium]MCB1091316.1 single-stranded DNA-binding protein [Verrucomicrobiae bacterium]
MSGIAERLLEATNALCSDLSGLEFAEPTTHVYNPLIYARAPHEQYLRRFGDSKKRVLLLGMNPGPFGMAQTGVPFGEIAAVRDWMGISAPVSKPEHEHPKRPVEGFACPKSEVSGRRLWGLFAERFPHPEEFFADHFVVNYCPLVWMEAGGKNRTPDKLPSSEMAPVTDACDRYLGRFLELLEPEFAVGVGGFAEQCLARVIERLAPGKTRPKLGRILHPSPASPAANRDWPGAATRDLQKLGIWP